MVSKKNRFSECRLVIDSWGQENWEIPKTMPGRHFKQILIRTKLNRPAIGKDCVERPRLVSRLDEALKGHVTLISAPAGYGKTTLVLQWIDHRRIPAAWFAVDEMDSDPDRFLGYVVAAIRTVFPEFGSDIERLLSAPQLPPPEHLADAMVNELAALNQPLLIVLDDYHRLASKTVHEIMTRVLLYLPDKLHVLLLTRKDPPFPLGLWSTRQWLVELRAADLRFTREETQAFFEKRLRKRLTDRAVGMLNGRTEGWVAALQLVQLSLATAKDPEQLVRRYSDSDRSITDYLMDEVVSHQPAEIIDFLATTAILERFCVPLCDYLLSGHKAAPDTRDIITRIEKENLFVVPLDNERRWYRYHHLFQSLLKHHLMENLPAKQRTRLHQHAGKWFAGQGLIEEALHHFLVARDVGAAAALLEDNLHNAIDNDLSRRTLARWLAMFPKSAVDQHPALGVATSYQKMTHWDFISMEPLLDQAEALLRNPAFPIEETRRLNLLQDVDIQRAFFFYWRGDIEAALRLTRQSLSVIPKEHRYAHNLAVLYTALAEALSGRRDEALQLLSEALIEDCAEGSRNAGVFLVAQTGVYYYAGDLNAVEVTAKQILSVHKTVFVPDFWYAYAPYFLACSAYERNLLDTAAEYFGQVEQMRYVISTRLYQDALMGLALAAWAKGETDRAWEYAAAARSFAREKSDPYSLQIANSFQTRMAILSGNVRDDPAKTAPPEDDSNKVWLEIPSLTLAEYQVHQSTFAECTAALQSVEDGLQQAKHHHNTRQVIQFLAVKAVALKCAGRLNESLETLEETLQMAEPLGFVRTFLDRGPLMAELLKALLEKSPENPYLHRLLDAFAAERPSERHTAVSSGEQRRLRSNTVPDEALPAELSNREIDVLIQLQERLSNKEIAQRLFISPETVKTHLSNIYQKLNVKNRRQAVDVSIRLDLLPERRRRKSN
jgi:LuxR family maltose regulon positive regulatory protein